MISYKYWKLLQESLDVNLGIKSPTNLGLTTEAPMLGMMLGKGKPGMGKPGMGKPGMGDDMGGDDHPHDDMGGDDEDNPHGDEDDDDMGDDDEDEGGDDEDDMSDDDDGAHDTDTDDMGDDDDEGDDQAGDMGPGGDMGGPPMGKPGMKKPPMGSPAMMNKKMMYMKKEGKEVLPWEKGKKDADDTKKRKQTKKDATDNDEKDTVDANKKKHGGFCNKCDKSKKMTKENQDFLNNLQKMTGGVKFAKDELGFWVPVNEDRLITNKKQEEPKPGEVGYAPNQYMGLSGTGEPSYQEWVGRRKK